VSVSRRHRVSSLLDSGELDRGSSKTNRSELDSHADTCCAGVNTTPFAFSEETVSVSPFIDEYSPMKDVKIASVVTMYDDAVTGDSIFLVILEALYFGKKLHQTLLNPNQLRNHGNHVHDVPCQFDNNSKHSITIPAKGLNLPLALDGIISYLPTRKPTHGEMEEFRSLEPESWIELTSDAPWKPYDKSFKKNEDRLANDARTTAQVSTNRINGCKLQSLSRSISLARRVREDRRPTNRGTLSERLISMVNVAADDMEGDGLEGRNDEMVYPTNEDDRVLMKMKLSERGSVITKEILARRWRIGLETAKRMLQATQAGNR
jgi:hypothetical protein